MASIRLFPLNWRFSKDDGSFAFTDGTISFYVGGTGNSSKTPITVYTDKDLVTGPRTTVSIDSDGYPAYEQIWGSDANSYDIGVLATGFNGGVEKIFPYAELAASAASANTDSALAFKNALTNGGFTNWTSATSFSNISGSAAAAEVADDWFFSQNGTAANAISRQTADKTGARYGLRMGRPPASTSAEQHRLYQALPIDEAYRMRGKTVTVSFNLKKGADFSASNIAILIATGTAEGESGNLMATGGWTGQVSALTQTQVPDTTSVRYQFSATLASNIKEAGLQLSYTPSGTAG
jgi:hypothetical protein